MLAIRRFLDFLWVSVACILYFTCDSDMNLEHNQPFTAVSRFSQVLSSDMQGEVHCDMESALRRALKGP